MTSRSWSSCCRLSWYHTYSLKYSALWIVYAKG